MVVEVVGVVVGVSMVVVVIMKTMMKGRTPPTSCILLNVLLHSFLVTGSGSVHWQVIS